VNFESLNQSTMVVGARHHRRTAAHLFTHRPANLKTDTFMHCELSKRVDSFINEMKQGAKNDADGKPREAPVTTATPPPHTLMDLAICMAQKRRLLKAD
jgi:hypothetical protein